MLRRGNRSRLGALVLCAGLVLTGCGGEAPKKSGTSPSPSAAETSPSVSVPDGVTLTKAGTDLRFGQAATVAYQPNPKRATVLRLQVMKVSKGHISDLSMYTLDNRARASVPYYVKVRVRNVGTGDVGRTPIPLWAVDSTNTLVQASSFTNVFARCPSQALPAVFAPHAATKACLVYLVPRTNRVTGISFRPLQAFEPIVWTGAITMPKVPAKKAAKKGKKKS